MRGLRLLTALLACSLWLTVAMRLRAEPQPPPEAEVGTEEATRREEAKREFRLGFELASAGDWAQALPHFARSKDLLDTKVAALNVALCLQNLMRYRAASVAYDQVEANHAARLTEADRAQIAEGRRLIQLGTGILAVTTAPVGADALLDGVDIGKTPVSVRADAGLHIVRLRLKGFEPNDQPVTVEAGETATVRVVLSRPQRFGRLRVHEHGGAQLDVYVDGSAVGLTPWSGKVTAGPHEVHLRGSSGDDEVEDLSTEQRAVTVPADGVADLELTAERTDARLAVNVSPATAEIRVDGRTVGSGTWTGSLRRGTHTVLASAPGYEPKQVDVATAPGGTRSVDLRLERMDAGRRWLVDLALGYAAAPSLGGALDGACSIGRCSSRSQPAGWLAGARAGRDVANRAAVELFGGYLTMSEEATREQVAFGKGETLASSRFREDVRLHGPLLALSASYRFLQATPITARVWAGALRAAVTTSAGGSFFSPALAAGTSAHATLQLDVPQNEEHAWMPVVGSELRAGYRFARRVTLDVGVTALIALPTGIDVASTIGGRTLPHESALGPFVAFVPALGVRYEL